MRCVYVKCVICGAAFRVRVCDTPTEHDMAVLVSTISEIHHPSEGEA